MNEKAVKATDILKLEEQAEECKMAIKRMIQRRIRRPGMLISLACYLACGTLAVILTWMGSPVLALAGFILLLSSLALLMLITRSLYRVSFDVEKEFRVKLLEVQREIARREVWEG